MKLVTGVDLIEIDRIDQVLDQHGQHYLDRVFTAEEIALSGRRVESLAGRFAAKEAVAKALGCGIGEVTWKEIEILENEAGAPILQLFGEAALKAEALGVETWSVSISHSQSHAMALAVAVGP
jgi:holo-[acyl-carrier protein] synthase